MDEECLATIVGLKLLVAQALSAISGLDDDRVGWLNRLEGNLDLEGRLEVTGGDPEALTRATASVEACIKDVLRLTRKAAGVPEDGSYAAASTPTSVSP